jgi:PRC-barrel domain
LTPHRKFRGREAENASRRAGEALDQGNDMRARHLLMPLIACLLTWSAATSWAQDDKANPPQPGQQRDQPGAPKEPAPPPSVTIIGASEAHGVLGRDVRSATGEDMGRIVDVIVDRAGTVRAAVIDFGGFLGVGSRKIVVDWSALHFGRIASKGDSITLELTKEQVVAAPEYKDGTLIVVLGATGSLQPLQFDH